MKWIILRLLLTWHEWREAVHGAEKQLGLDSGQFRYHQRLADYHGIAADKVSRLMLDGMLS